MEDLSLHILDVVENSTRAGADEIEISLLEDTGKDLLEIVIRDNGRGMEPEMLERATDPFVTSRTTRRVGLGMPMLAQAAREAGGEFKVMSEPGKGTEVRATFQASHIDRKPLGDISSTLITLIAGNPHVDFIFASHLNGEETLVDTRVIRAELNGAATMNHPAVLKFIRALFSKDRQDAEGAHNAGQDEKNA
jgi:anti-sigma regulatory factor (Ser/Thr protein kinase)